ncbi:MAG: GatB/YqeY domain-containing protein [Myxococcales bacterium]|nr:GatB/YqeY domain-containing protein [Myxococcales bacterium]
MSTETTESAATSTTIRDQIEGLLRQARRDRDEATKNVIGMLKNKVLTRLKDGSGATEDDALWLESIASYAKEVQKAIGKFEEAGDKGAELLAEARFEVAFCERFLPSKLDEAATEALVRRLAEEQKITNPKQIGRLIGAVMKGHKDEVDAALVRAAAEMVLGG